MSCEEIVLYLDQDGMRIYSLCLVYGQGTGCMLFINSMFIITERI